MAEDSLKGSDFPTKMPALLYTEIPKCCASNGSAKFFALNKKKSNKYTNNNGTKKL